MFSLLNREGFVRNVPERKSLLPLSHQGLLWRFVLVWILLKRVIVRLCPTYFIFSAWYNIELLWKIEYSRGYLHQDGPEHISEGLFLTGVRHSPKWAVFEWSKGAEHMHASTLLCSWLVVSSSFFDFPTMIKCNLEL